MRKRRRRRSPTRTMRVTARCASPLWMTPRRTSTLAPAGGLLACVPVVPVSGRPRRPLLPLPDPQVPALPLLL